VVNGKQRRKEKQREREMVDVVGGGFA